MQTIVFDKIVRNDQYIYSDDGQTLRSGPGAYFGYVGDVIYQLAMKPKQADLTQLVQDKQFWYVFSGDGSAATEKLIAPILRRIATFPVVAGA